MLAGCGCAARIPLPEAARGLDARAVVARVREHRSHTQSYSSEIRLQYFGAEGRYKGTAHVFARRPDHLRYDVQSPHGGVLLAFATDGQRLAALDMGANRLVRGLATPAHFDALLPLAPLGFTASAWVALLFGEIDVPDDAALSYDDRAGLFWLRWARGTYDVCVGVDPKSFDPKRATGTVRGTEQWRVELSPRDTRGLPTALRITTPTSGTDIGLRWRDVEVDADLADAMFTLPTPRGARVDEMDTANEAGDGARKP